MKSEWKQGAKKFFRVTGTVLREICTVPDSLFRVYETIFLLAMRYF